MAETQNLEALDDLKNSVLETITRTELDDMAESIAYTLERNLRGQYGTVRFSFRSNKRVEKLMRDMDLIAPSSVPSMHPSEVFTDKARDIYERLCDEGFYDNEEHPDQTQ